MSWKRYFRRRTWDREREEEIAVYIELETTDNRERGMSAEEAGTPRSGNSATPPASGRRFTT